MSEEQTNRLVKDFTSSRLRIARQRRGFTKKILASKADVSTTSLSLFENDKQQPSENTLVRLAYALNVPVAFLTASDMEALPTESASFRSLSKMTVRQSDQARAAGAWAVALSKLVESRFQLLGPDVPQLSGVDSELAAEAVREAWELGNRPIGNMIHLLEAHGVRVFSLAIDCHEVDAFSTWVDGVPYVFLNTTKSSERTRMDAAHELSHLVRDRGHGSVRGKDIEKDANAFAAAFLMPRASVLEEALCGANTNVIIQAKKRWNVAAVALARRLHELGMLSDWQYRHVVIEIGRKKEPEPSPAETSQVLEKVFNALKSDGVTRAQVAQQLNIYLDDLHGMTFVPMSLSPNKNAVQHESSPRRSNHLQLISKHTDQNS